MGFMWTFYSRKKIERVEAKSEGCSAAVSCRQRHKPVILLLFIIWSTVPEGMCKPHKGNQDFSQLTNGVYFIVIIKKTSLRNENSPIANLITKMGVSSTYL